MPDQTQPLAIPAAASERIQQRLDREVRRLLKQRGVRHALVAIESGDGAFRFRRAIGTARPDGTPLGEAAPLPFRFIPRLLRMLAP